MAAPDSELLPGKAGVYRGPEPPKRQPEARVPWSDERPQEPFFLEPVRLEMRNSVSSEDRFPLGGDVPAFCTQRGAGLVRLSPPDLWDLRCGRQNARVQTSSVSMQKTARSLLAAALVRALSLGRRDRPLSSQRATQGPPSLRSSARPCLRLPGLEISFHLWSLRSRDIVTKLLTAIEKRAANSFVHLRS